LLGFKQADFTPEVAALADLMPQDRDLVQRVLEDHPLLSLEEAVEMLRYFGGL
jgi:hypothetical protein